MPIFKVTALLSSHSDRSMSLDIVGERPESHIGQSYWQLVSARVLSFTLATLAVIQGLESCECLCFQETRTASVSGSQKNQKTTQCLHKKKKQ